MRLSRLNSRRNSMLLGMMRWPWGGIAALWACFILGVYAISQVDIGGYGLYAFDVYFQSARVLLKDQSIYQGTSGWVYLYPPFLAQTLIPLISVDRWLEAEFIWFGVNVALLVWTVYALSRYLSAPSARWMWIAPIFFFPIGQALFIGQVTIIMTALLAAAWIAIQRQRPGAAGALIALSAWIKIYPALLVVYFLYKGDWRVLRGVIVAGVALALGQIIVSGPEQFIAFFDVLFDLTAQGQPAGTFENNSIFAFASRLFQKNYWVEPLFISPALFQASRLGLTALVFGTAGLAIWRSQTGARNLAWRFDIEYGLVIMTILLFGSTMWTSGLPPLLLVYVLILRNRDELPRPAMVQALCAVSYVLVSGHLLITLGYAHEPLPALVRSAGFFGVMIAWGVMVYVLLAGRTIPGAPSAA